MSPKKQQLLRFLSVGVTALIGEYFVFYTLLFILNWSLLIANSLSFGAGLLISFTLNRLWAFNEETEYKHKAHRQFIVYGLLALVNLALSNLLISGLDVIGIDPRIGKVLSIGMIACWNFLIYRNIIFSKKSA